MREMLVVVAKGTNGDEAGNEVGAGPPLPGREWPTPYIGMRQKLVAIAKRTNDDGAGNENGAGPLNVP